MSGVLDANAGVGASAAVEGRKQSARCSIGRPSVSEWMLRNAPRDSGYILKSRNGNVNWDRGWESLPPDYRDVAVQSREATKALTTHSYHQSGHPAMRQRAAITPFRTPVSDLSLSETCLQTIHPYHPRGGDKRLVVCCVGGPSRINQHHDSLSARRHPLGIQRAGFVSGCE